MSPFWRKNKTPKKAEIAPAVVDHSLPKTADEFRIDEKLDRLHLAHEQFTRVLHDVTKDIRKNMGEKTS